ncbi:single-stranded DNA-binding protein [Isoptericola halotolerans]|uniref:single-stranded DNA-binding protein n=1 Tax=Isoptericola halotolerans TaxID=300560 RepID=UPI003890D9BD
MSDAIVTVTGYVGTSPALHLSPHDVPWTSFRVASTRRVRDPRTGEWRDGKTAWFTVKAFRGAARTVSESLVQGQPVVLTGRLSTEEWTDRDGRERTSLVVDADAVGPDATRGMTRFTRVVHESSGEPVGRAVASGAPDRSDPWAVAAAPDDARALTGGTDDQGSTAADDLTGAGDDSADDGADDGADEPAASTVG